MWYDLSRNEKLSLITSIQEQRFKLLKQRSTKPTRKSKKKPADKMTFKSKELEDLFHKLPADIQKFITS